MQDDPETMTAVSHAPTHTNETHSSNRRLISTLAKARDRCNPSLRLENTGSVARDHLASERTFLAYVRTSLTIAGTGVALVQLFTISASTTNIDIRKFSRPLGATIIITGLITLLIGITRFFTVQDALTKGHYPVAKLTIAFIAIVITAIVVIVFGILVSTRE